MRRAIASPRPVPPCPTLGRDQRLEDAAEMSCGMPLPSSLTRMTASLPSSRTSQSQPAATLTHGIAGIDEQVGDNLLQVVKVPAHVDLGISGTCTEYRLRAKEVLVEAGRRGDEHVVRTRSTDARACGGRFAIRSRQAVDQVRGPETLLLHFLQEPVLRIVGSGFGQQ